MTRKDDTVSAPRKDWMGVVVLGSEEKTVAVSFLFGLGGVSVIVSVIVSVSVEDVICAFDSSGSGRIAVCGGSGGRGRFTFLFREIGKASRASRKPNIAIFWRCE